MPIARIAFGIAVLVGRPQAGSTLASLIIACVIVVLGLAAPYLLRPDARITEQQTFAHPLGSAIAKGSARSCEGCSTAIGGPVDPRGRAAKPSRASK